MSLFADTLELRVRHGLAVDEEAFDHGDRRVSCSLVHGVGNGRGVRRSVIERYVIPFFTKDASQLEEPLMR